MRTQPSIHLGAYVQTGDPGAIGAKKLWVDTTGVVKLMKRRNDANSGWEVVGLNAAASNPGSPGSGQPLFRTDQGELIYYNGSQWVRLGKPLPFIRYSDSQDPPYNVSQQALIFALTFPLAYLITHFGVGYYVAGTNNGSNYWDINLVKYNSAVSAATVATLTTSDKAGSTNAKMSAPSFANNPSATSDLWYMIELAKIGSPGGLYFHGLSVYAREVQT